MTTLTEMLVEQWQTPRVLYRDLKIVYDGMVDVVYERSPDLKPAVCSSTLGEPILPARS